MGPYSSHSTESRKTKKHKTNNYDNNNIRPMAPPPIHPIPTTTTPTATKPKPLYQQTQTTFTPTLSSIFHPVIITIDDKHNQLIPKTNSDTKCDASIQTKSSVLRSAKIENQKTVEKANDDNNNDDKQKNNGGIAL